MSALSHIQRNILILRSLLEFEDTFKGSNYNVSNDERVQWDISYLVWKNYYQKKTGKELFDAHEFKKKSKSEHNGNQMSKNCYLKFIFFFNSKTTPQQHNS